MKRFSESQVYALKVLRLAVYLKNNFEEYKAIEALKILSFHEGKINNSKEEFLKKAKFLKKGEMDGDFEVKSDCYNIKISELKEISEVLK